MTAAAIYARISQDRVGEGLGVERQLTECRQLAERLGFTVVAEYIDNDVSATTGKVRPEFEKLLASKSDVILAWHQDRLLRKGSDLERVIDLNVPVYTVAAGTLDLTTPAGRAVARTVAAWSQYEGEQKAERQRARNRQTIAKGLPVLAHRAFGWEADGITLHPEEAPILVAMHERILAGDSLRGITAWLNDMQVYSPKTGKPWTHAGVRSVLRRPRNAGLLVSKGVIQPVSQIQPAVSVEVSQAVAAILDGRAQPGRPVEKWWLSSAMHCFCGAPMGSKTVQGKGRKTPSYMCRVALDTNKGGHATIGADIAHQRVMESLHMALVLDGYEDHDDNSVVSLRAELSKVEQERVEVMQLWTVPGADRTWITARLAELGQAHEQTSRALEAALVDRATSDVAASIKAAMVPATEPWEFDAEQLADHLDESAGALAESWQQFLQAFDALTVEQKRDLVKSRLAISVQPAKGYGYGVKRIRISPRQRPQPQD